MQETDIRAYLFMILVVSEASYHTNCDLAIRCFCMHGDFTYMPIALISILLTMRPTGGRLGVAVGRGEVRRGVAVGWAGR